MEETKKFSMGITNVHCKIAFSNATYIEWNFTVSEEEKEDPYHSLIEWFTHEISETFTMPHSKGITCISRKAIEYISIIEG